MATYLARWTKSGCVIPCWTSIAMTKRSCPSGQPSSIHLSLSISICFSPYTCLARSSLRERTNLFDLPIELCLLVKYLLFLLFDSLPVTTAHSDSLPPRRALPQLYTTPLPVTTNAIVPATFSRLTLPGAPHCSDYLTISGCYRSPRPRR